MNHKLHVLASFFNKPDRLAEIDSIIDPSYFNDAERTLYIVIYNLYYQGVTTFNEKVVLDYLSSHPVKKQEFLDKQGKDLIMLLQHEGDINFNYHYEMLCKENLILEYKQHIDMGEWYCDDVLDIETQSVINQKIEKASIDDIRDYVHNLIYSSEQRFFNKKGTEISDASFKLRELIESYETAPSVGLPLVDPYFSSATRGARKTKLYCVSASTGSGKTRTLVANMCKVSCPIVFRSGVWQILNSNEKSLFVTNELQVDEVQTMLLAHIAGVDEDAIKLNSATPEEKERIQIAINLLENLDNITILTLPDPSIGDIKTNIRQLCIQHGITNVFYDYIAVSPSLLSDFKGTRDDVALLLITSALKDLANELQLFIMTATQVNAKGEDSNFIDEACIRGSRAVADKLDVGIGMRIPTQEQLKEVANLIEQYGISPNRCFDIYKNRGSKHAHITLWLDYDLSIMDYRVLFITKRGSGIVTTIDLIEVNPNNEGVSVESMKRDYEKTAQKTLLL